MISAGVYVDEVHRMKMNSCYINDISMVMLDVRLCKKEHFDSRGKSIFKCYFSKELIALTVSTGFEPATCGSQNQSANQCTNRE